MIAIRPLQTGDIELVVEIATGLKEAPQWPLTAYREAVMQDLPRRVSLIAENLPEGETAGFLIARIVGDEAELETLAVAPRLQRQGIAGKLLAHLIEVLHKETVTEVMLEVRCSNAPALALYRKTGFGETGRRRGYYADPVEDAVLLKLRLPGMNR